MFSYIIGDVKFLGQDYIVLENNNIGYKILMPTKSISSLTINENHKIYTEFVVREDGVYLYGFLSIDQLEMFLHLNSVSSIGPKASLSILSSLEVYEIKLAILGNDIKKLTQAQGIGAKSASRIILELSDKINPDSIIKEDLDILSNEDLSSKDYDFAIEALLNLGYSKADATRALKGIDLKGLALSDIVKMALKRI
ncbi:Holliday junction branch migration protein RuvA [Peptoniphilaceae bacterium SGI.131]